MSSNIKFRAGKTVSTDLNPRQNRSGSGGITSRISGSAKFSCEYLVIGGGGAGVFIPGHMVCFVGRLGAQ
jgi:hypothetical protein